MNYKPVKVALIGSGNISYTYLNTLTKGFSILEVVGCSDLVPEKSKARAELFGIKQMTTEEILNDPEIELVINTTEIHNHAKVSRMILEAGKHVYSEKSMGCDFEEAKANVEFAKSKGLRVGSAPDIYMGAAYQTARKLIDEGWIGEPLTAAAYCIRGYQDENKPGTSADKSPYGTKGTTIPYDMGGYYINVLVALLGPIKTVAGFSKVFDKAVYGNVTSPAFGQPVSTNGGVSIIQAALEFESGVYGSLVMSGNGFAPEIPRVEIYGTKGTLMLPDPNYFGGWGREVILTRIGNEGSFRVPFTHGFGDTDPDIPPKSGHREPCHNSWRGIAVVDMCYAIREGREQRSSAELALHTVEIMNALENHPGTVHAMETHPKRPEPLKEGVFGNVDVLEGSIIY